MSTDMHFSLAYHAVEVQLQKLYSCCGRTAQPISSSKDGCTSRPYSSQPFRDLDFASQSIRQLPRPASPSHAISLQVWIMNGIFIIVCPHICTPTPLVTSSIVHWPDAILVSCRGRQQPLGLATHPSDVHIGTMATTIRMNMVGYGAISLLGPRPDASSSSTFVPLSEGARKECNECSWRITSRRCRMCVLTS